MNAQAVEKHYIRETVAMKFMRWVEDQLNMAPGIAIVGTTRDLVMRAFGNADNVNVISTHLSYLARHDFIKRDPLPTGVGYIYTISEKTLERPARGIATPTRVKTTGGRMGTGQFGAAQPKKFVSESSKFVKKIEDLDERDEPTKIEVTLVQPTVQSEIISNEPKMIDDHVKESREWTDYGYSREPMARSMRDVFRQMQMLANDVNRLIDEFGVSLDKIEREEELNKLQPLDLTRASDDELLAEIRRRLDIEKECG